MSYFNFLAWYYQVLIGIPFFILSILFHEQAHYKMLKNYYKDAKKPNYKKIPFEVSWEKGIISTEQENDVYWAGILFGLYPIVIMLSFVDPLIFFMFLIFYYVGCTHDFKELYKRIPTKK